MSDQVEHQLDDSVPVSNPEKSDVLFICLISSTIRNSSSCPLHIHRHSHYCQLHHNHCHSRHYRRHNYSRRCRPLHHHHEMDNKEQFAADSIFKLRCLLEHICVSPCGRHTLVRQLTSTALDVVCCCIMKVLHHHHQCHTHHCC